jgi:uncharacterized damage-inducible protein DinB
MKLVTKAIVTTLSLAVAVLAGTSLSPALAQTPGAGGVKQELLFWIEDAEKKLIELAEATPEAKYKWRPSKDSRTTGEVFMHVVTANYGIPGLAGIKPPEGFNFETHEKSLTKKADIDKALKDSFAHAKQALTDATEADLNKPIDMFGSKTTFRGAYLLVLAHNHEHLGQAIAYARSNKIAPPWTERNKARFEAMRKEAAEKAKAAAK